MVCTVEKHNEPKGPKRRPVRLNPEIREVANRLLRSNELHNERTEELKTAKEWLKEIIVEVYPPYSISPILDLMNRAIVILFGSESENAEPVTKEEVYVRLLRGIKVQVIGPEDIVDHSLDKFKVLKRLLSVYVKAGIVNDDFMEVLEALVEEALDPRIDLSTKTGFFKDV